MPKIKYLIRARAFRRTRDIWWWSERNFLWGGIPLLFLHFYLQVRLYSSFHLRLSPSSLPSPPIFLLLSSPFPPILIYLVSAPIVSNEYIELGNLLLSVCATSAVRPSISVGGRVVVSSSPKPPCWPTDAFCYGVRRSRFTPIVSTEFFPGV